MSDSFVAMDDGARIRVRADPPSARPALLFSNSLGTDLRMWDAEAAAFAARFRVIRYDSRGHGQSDAPPGPYTMERLGRDAVGILDSLGIERTHFCGLSMGGMVGQWLGVNATERLTRMVLANTAACMPPRENWEKRIAAVRQGGMAAVADLVMNIWFTETFRKRAPEDVDRIRAIFLATPPTGYVACCEAIRDMDQREAIRAIRTPTLVIAGALDRSTPPDRGRLIHDAIAGSAFVVFPDAAHLSNIQVPEMFDRTIRDFLVGLERETGHGHEGYIFG